MALFRIERQMPETSEDDDIEAAGFRSTSCLAMFPHIEWIRSYFDREALHLTCYYEAADPEDIRRHAERALIPCDAIAEVVEYLPESYR